MKTNGMIDSPPAMAAPGLATPPSVSSAADTRPASSSQNAGTSSSVARVMARHALCGGPSGCMPGAGHGGQPFTEPAVRPRTK